MVLPVKNDCYLHKTAQMYKKCAIIKHSSVK